MILFWVLFFLIVLISAILAYLSMRDFRQGPQDNGLECGPFLIRKPYVLNSHLLNSMHQMIEKKGLIISLERLFKGGESALVFYGPKNVLSAFAKSLDLLELEDYSNKEGDVSAWEMGIKGKSHLQMMSLFSDFPKLEGDEQVWYQIVLQAQRGLRRQFSCQIRVVVRSSDKQRMKKLSETLKAPYRAVLEQAFSTTLIMDFYRKRSMGGESFLKLTGEEIVKLWSLPKPLPLPELPPRLALGYLTK